jgi:hypothetical protein
MIIITHLKRDTADLDSPLLLPEKVTGDEV